MNLQKAGKGTRKVREITWIKISVCLLFIASFFKSTRAYSAVTVSSIISTITVWSDVLNPVLEMGVSLTTICLGIVTIRHYLKKSKGDD